MAKGSRQACLGKYTLYNNRASAGKVQCVNVRATHMPSSYPRTACIKQLPGIEKEIHFSIPQEPDPTRPLTVHVQRQRSVLTPCQPGSTFLHAAIQVNSAPANQLST